MCELDCAHFPDQSVLLLPFTNTSPPSAHKQCAPTYVLLVYDTHYKSISTLLDFWKVPSMICTVVLQISAWHQLFSRFVPFHIFYSLSSMMPHFGTFRCFHISLSFVLCSTLAHIVPVHTFFQHKRFQFPLCLLLSVPYACAALCDSAVLAQHCSPRTRIRHPGK